ncbi:hypothetical protein DPEC_G00175870 [Dallia pectoralis]|uniref:Uncharacterized protein n=1 Tax=Dallia pectoralis TaxID=75939 RepID=A0ACC2GEH5_DALPE|nr:hypothetical protein DPEC_G00175870 [Dallia pectoralis]
MSDSLSGYLSGIVLMLSTCQPYGAETVWHLRQPASTPTDKLPLTPSLSMPSWRNIQDQSPGATRLPPVTLRAGISLIVQPSLTGRSKAQTRWRTAGMECNAF